MRRLILIFVALVALQAPWLEKPIDIDEANFMVLTRGAVADWWRPHAVTINWTGKTESSFDVLSNPPGIAWWLVPVAAAPLPLQRAWMFPWLALAIFGAWRLGLRFGSGDETSLVLLVSPIVLLSTTALLPDAPLYACTLAGVAGYVDAVDHRRSALPWALLAGCAALFRYSGATLAPLLALYSLLQRQPPWSALGAWMPLALLGLHDWSAYGHWHLLAMTGFQLVRDTGPDVLHKLAAALAMLGGVAALPIFAWPWHAAAGAWVGAAIGSSYGWSEGAFAAAGGAGLACAFWFLASAERRRDHAWLAVWAAGGLLFLVSLRMMAARYWLPFLPAVLLALPLGRFARLWIALSVVLGTALAADGYFQARAVRRLAEEAASYGTGGFFVGHWGWQWTLEELGWKPLEVGTRPPQGSTVAIVRQAGPQAVDVKCSKLLWRGEAMPPHRWLPRSYSEQGRSNLHSNWIAGPPFTRTVAPWSFADDPYEQAWVCQDLRRPGEPSQLRLREPAQ
jgi:hypothetical protein